MPWAASDASKHALKAKSKKARDQWAKVADSVLSRTGDDSLAIKEANGVTKRRTKGGKGKRR